jgi:psiF repeat
MLQRVFMLGLFAAMLFSAPAFAITAQEKMKTCEFGADDQKLTGPARKTFMSKCMANSDAPAAKKPKQQSMQQPTQPPMQPPPMQQQK